MIVTVIVAGQEFLRTTGFVIPADMEKLVEGDGVLRYLYSARPPKR